MIVAFENEPLAVHAPFHRSRAFERANFGAFGSGKTYALIDEVHAWALEQPGIRMLVARKTVPELRDTTEPIFRERMPAALWVAGEERRSGGHMESFTYPNGSVVLFRSLDDWNKHRSLNLGAIAYDECNEIDEETYLGMLSRVRQVDLTAEARERGYTGKITRRGIWLSTNPAGKDWLWRRFHPDSPDTAPNTAAFMSRTIDNPFLPPEYVESLLQYPKPWVQRYVLCQFDDFAGRIYENWGYDTHVIPHPNWDAWNSVDLAGRVFWMGMDPGTQNPTAGLWVWLDVEQRRLVGVAEYEQAGVSVDVHARAWRAIEAAQKMNIRWRVGDPNSITQRDRGTVMSLQTQYAKAGFNFTLGASAEKDRIPALGRLIELNRFVVTERCPKTFEAIKNYQWKDLTPAQRAAGEDPKEVPLKKDTHLVECAQYIAAREAPVLRPDKRRPQNLSDEIHRAIRKQLTSKFRQRKGYGGRGHDLGGMAV
jgi:PBSX family phage terminase large subunit